MLMPKISVITAVKNNKVGLLQTINSIRAQNYKSIEYIVIDGGSTDGTVEVLKENQDVVNHWISEPDDGISDAFNKGLRLSTGDYINFQGAGDTFYHPDSLQRLFEQGHKKTDLICGQVVRSSLSGESLWIAPKKISPKFSKKTLLWKLTLPHQALFTHRSFFKKWGEFDVNVKFAMDYDILLRAYHDFPSVTLLPVVIANWQAGGIGSCQIKAVLKEYHSLKLKHRVGSALCLHLIHEFNLFKFFIKTKVLQREY